MRAHPMTNQTHSLENLKANNEEELYELRTVVATWRYPMDSESCMHVLLVQSFILVERVITYTILIPSNAMIANQPPRASRTGLTYKGRTKPTKRCSGMTYKSRCKTCRCALTCSHCAIKKEMKKKVEPQLQKDIKKEMKTLTKLEKPTMSPYGKPEVKLLAESPVENWHSVAVPATIRRPWQIFEQYLADRIDEDYDSDGSGKADVRAQWSSVQTVGAEIALAVLTEREQRVYVDLSLQEVSAYVCWQRAVFKCSGRFSDPSDWDKLDIDVKIDWLPGGDWRRIIAEEAVFAPLLHYKRSKADERLMLIRNAKEALGMDIETKI